MAGFTICSCTFTCRPWAIASAHAPLSLTRHRASTIMYSLTFCVRFLLPERHQWKPAVQTVQTAAVMLRTPPVAGQSPAGGARRPGPAGRSHYVVISRDAQLGGSLYHAPKLHPGPRNSVGVRPRRDRHTDTDVRDHNTFCVVYDSCKM